MDRLPKKPPFPVGARLRYVGTRESYWGTGTNGEVVAIIKPGVEVVIDATRPGFQGTLRQIRDEYWEDTGEPILDTTCDGASVYHVTDPSGAQHGRLVLQETASEWERIA